MGALLSELYSTVPNGDPLNFGIPEKIDYKKVSNWLNFDNNDLSKMSGISKKSVRFDQNIPNELKERLEQIAIICSLVAEYFDSDPAKTFLWFKTPNPMLGDISPRDMLRLGRFKKLRKFVLEARTDHGAKAT